MNNNFLVLCLMAHFIGDYYLQSQELAKIKDETYRGVIKHSILYCIPFVFISILFITFKELYIDLLLIVTLHFIIDWIKYLYVTKILNGKKKCLFVLEESIIYIMDQSIHLVIIVLLSYMNRSIHLTPLPMVERFFNYFNLETSQLLKWILLIIILDKPVNISFKKIFSSFKPSVTIVPMNKNSNELLSAASIDNQLEEKQVKVQEEVEKKNAGQFIGFLERILISIFLNLGQYASIGFIMTAKSIARYDKISKSQEFAEYYLIGTLASMIMAFITYFFVFVII